jgi:hypothetical protein
MKAHHPLLAALCTLCALSMMAAPPLRAQSPIPAPPPTPPQGTPNGVVELDRNGDGKVDYRVLYDSAGRVSQEQMDFKGNGIMDTFYYYKDGVLQRVEIDSKDNGKIDIWVYLLDGKYVQRYERDTTGSGKPDIVRTFGGGG